MTVVADLSGKLNLLTNQFELVQVLCLHLVVLIYAFNFERKGDVTRDDF